MSISIDYIRKKLLGVDYSHLSEEEARHKLSEIEEKLQVLESGYEGLGPIQKKQMISELEKKQKWIKQEFDF